MSDCPGLLEFPLGPSAEASAVALNTGGANIAEGVTVGAFGFNHPKV
jgi:hypothetical protein